MWLAGYEESRLAEYDAGGQYGLLGADIARMVAQRLDSLKGRAGFWGAPPHGSVARLRKHYRDAEKPCKACLEAARVHRNPAGSHSGGRRK